MTRVKEQEINVQHLCKVSPCQSDLSSSMHKSKMHQLLRLFHGSVLLLH